MSSAAAVKLSPALKSLIAAPHALGSPVPSPSKRATLALFDKIRSEGESGGVEPESWLTVSSAALVTVNSPETVCALFDYAKERRGGLEDQVMAAAVIRETALKSISFSGIARIINNLTAFRSHLPEPVKQGLSTESLRMPTPDNLATTSTRGRALWDSVYEPHSTKLLSKLSAAHPDLPTHILQSHYGPLLSDPFRTAPPGHFKVGRVLTSLVAIACLRAQQGVGPQVTSHVFGLKKALLEGGGAEGEEPVKGQEWLTSDEGVTWVISSTDDISRVVGEGRTTFGGGMKRESKL